MYSYFNPLADKGPFVIGLQTKNEQATKALEVVRDTLHQFITHGPSEHELSSAKQNLTGRFPLRLDSNKSIASNLLNIGFYNLPLDYLDTYRDNINAVTKEQVYTAFKQHIDPQQMFIITVGKKKISW